MIFFLDFLAKFDPRPHLVVLGVGAKSDGFGGNDSGLVSVIIFTVDAEEDGGCSLARQEYDGTVKSTLQIITGQNKEDLSWVNEIPTRIERVGLPDIKHVELYDKWKPLVPEAHWTELIYFNKEPTQEQRKRVRGERGSSKQARRKRQCTDQSATTAQQPAQSK